MGDDWATPEWLWGKFVNYFDPCPANSHDMRQVDGFSSAEDWVREIDRGFFNGLKLNPPHSKPGGWVKRGIEVAKSGKHVVMLLRLDSTTEAHKQLIEAGFHPFGAFERIAYGNSENGGKYPNVLWFSPTALKESESP